MVLRVDVVAAALEAVYGDAPPARVIALTPQGRQLDQALVEELAAEPAHHAALVPLRGLRRAHRRAPLHRRDLDRPVRALGRRAAGDGARRRDRAPAAGRARRGLRRERDASPPRSTAASSIRTTRARRSSAAGRSPTCSSRATTPGSTAGGPSRAACGASRERRRGSPEDRCRQRDVSAPDAAGRRDRPTAAELRPPPIRRRVDAEPAGPTPARCRAAAPTRRGDADRRPPATARRRVDGSPAAAPTVRRAAARSSAPTGAGRIRRTALAEPGRPADARPARTRFASRSTGSSRSSAPSRSCCSSRRSSSTRTGSRRRRWRPTLHCAQPAVGCEARFSDRVLANRFLYRLRDPRRGEIIVFETPPAAQVEVRCGRHVREAPDRAARRDGGAEAAQRRRLRLHQRQAAEGAVHREAPGAAPSSRSGPSRSSRGTTS